MEQRAEAGIGLSDGVVADSEVAYRRIVEQSPLVVYTHDGSRPPAMTYVSPQVERMLGVPPARWLEQPFLLGHQDPSGRSRGRAGSDR